MQSHQTENGIFFLLLGLLAVVQVTPQVLVSIELSNNTQVRNNHVSAAHVLKFEQNRED